MGCRVRFAAMTIPIPIPTEAEASRLLHAALDALPPLQRALLTLYHIEEIPIPEIARITGLPAGTIKSHLFRSRLGLRNVLEALKGVAT